MQLLLLGHFTEFLEGDICYDCKTINSFTLSLKLLHKLQMKIVSQRCTGQRYEAWFMFAVSEMFFSVCSCFTTSFTITYLLVTRTSSKPTLPANSFQLKRFLGQFTYIEQFSITDSVTNGCKIWRHLPCAFKAATNMYQINHHNQYKYEKTGAHWFPLTAHNNSSNNNTKHNQR